MKNTIQSKIVAYLKEQNKALTLHEIVEGISEERSEVLKEIRRIPRDKIKLISMPSNQCLKYKVGRNA